MADEKKKEENPIDGLMTRIVNLSNVDDSSIPVARGYAWFGLFNSEGKLGPPVTFKLGQPSPFNDRMGIVALFQNENEVRVYSLPISEPKKGEPAGPARHTLSKMAPTFFFEMLPLDVFEAEIADELCELEESTAVRDVDDDGEPLLIRPKDKVEEEPEPEPETEPEPEPGSEAATGAPATDA